MEASVSRRDALPVCIAEGGGGIALTGAIVGELPTGAQSGIGSRMLAGSYYGQTIQIWSALVAASAVAAALVYGVGGIERIVNRQMGARA